ncbi:MAG: hypothetical protein QM777_08925 [Pseudorhodoferax sp.]
MLESDANTILPTSGAPVGNGVTSGDRRLDAATGLLYTWSTAWDAGVQFLPPLTTSGGGVGLVRQVSEVSNATLKASLRSALDGLDQNGTMPVKRGARVLAIFDTAANVLQSNTGTATLTDDATDPYAGATGVRCLWADTSARWLTPAVANQPYYTSGIDLTGMNIEFSFKRLSTSTQALGTRPSLQLRSDASTPASPSANRLQLTLDTAIGDPALNDDWQTVSIPIERFNVVGTGADITSIKLVSIARGGQSGTHDVILGNVRAVPRQLRKAVCCICISDNRADTWTNAVKTLSRYGFPATAQPGRVATNLRNTLDEYNMSPRELRKLQQLHGWQIGGQAFTTESAGAFDSYTDEQLLAEFSGIPRLYRSLGLWGCADGSYNPAIPVTAVKWTQLLRQVFRTMRVSYTHSAGQTPWPETSPIADPMRLKSWSRGASNNGAQLVAYVEKAVATKGMAVFSIHTWAASEPELVILLDWLHANRDKVDVVTLDTAIQRMASPTFNVYDGGAAADTDAAGGHHAAGFHQLRHREPDAKHHQRGDQRGVLWIAASSERLRRDRGGLRAHRQQRGRRGQHALQPHAGIGRHGGPSRHGRVHEAWDESPEGCSRERDAQPGGDDGHEQRGGAIRGHPGADRHPVEHRRKRRRNGGVLVHAHRCRQRQQRHGRVDVEFRCRGQRVHRVGERGHRNRRALPGPEDAVRRLGLRIPQVRRPRQQPEQRSVSRHHGRYGQPAHGRAGGSAQGHRAPHPGPHCGHCDAGGQAVRRRTWNVLQSWPDVPNSRYYIGLNMNQANLQPVVHVRGVGLT